MQQVTNDVYLMEIKQGIETYISKEELYTLWTKINDWMRNESKEKAKYDDLHIKLASPLESPAEILEIINILNEEEYEAEKAKLDKELDEYAAERDRVMAMKPHYTMAIKMLEKDIEMFSRYYIYKREIHKAYGVQLSREEAFKEWSEMSTELKNSFKPK